MKPIKFRPSPGFIAVELIKVPPKETRGESAKIIAPHSAQGKADNLASLNQVWDKFPDQALVVAVGKSLEGSPTDCEVGDIVYIRRQITVSDGILVEKKPYVILRQSDCFGTELK